MTDYKQLRPESTDELEGWIAYGDEDSLPDIKSRIEELQKDIEELQEEIRDLRISYLRLANAVAHIMPDRNKFFADLIPDSSLIPMTKLSPAARAVWEAAMNTPDDMPYEHDLAAALRAVADHIDHDWSAFNCIDALREIAAELDGPSYTSKSQEQRKRFLDFIEKATL